MEKENTIDYLLKIAKSLNSNYLINDLERIKERSFKENAEIILPLVGEFSSGKTTLLNALTDCKKLETATKPTTATIYEIHFGCDKCRATILNENNESIQVDDISQLNNETLADAKIVTVFDTSTQVPSTTILVDTPGLSSPDPKHKQTLVDFLPQADSVLLVVDANQQITRTTTDFIKTMELAKKSIFLIITKCDTKAPSELEEIKKYIKENSQLPLSQMICVSATVGDLEEMYDLLKDIQEKKNDIIRQADAGRIKNIIHALIRAVDAVIKDFSSDKQLEDAISQQESDLRKLNWSIKKIIDDSQTEIDDKERLILSKFEDVIFEKLEYLISNKSPDFDSDAIATINTTIGLLLNEYRNDITGVLKRQAKKQYTENESISAEVLMNLDLSFISVDNIGYNIQLNKLGHEYDGVIATGLKIAAAAVVAGTTLAVGGGPMIPDVLTTASPVQNGRKINHLNRILTQGGKIKDQYAKIEDMNTMPSDKGCVESLVGWATDKMKGKPQRKRALHCYLDETLIPSFTSQLQDNSKQLLLNISITLQEETSDVIENKKGFLQQLKQERDENKVVYEQKMKQLKAYKKELLTIKD